MVFKGIQAFPKVDEILTICPKSRASIPEGGRVERETKK